MRITKAFNWRHASRAEGTIVLKLKAHGKGLETSGDNSLATALVTEKGSETTSVYELLWVHMKFALFFLKSDIFFDDYCVSSMVGKAVAGGKKEQWWSQISKKGWGDDGSALEGAAPNQKYK